MACSPSGGAAQLELSHYSGIGARRQCSRAMRSASDCESISAPGGGGLIRLQAESFAELLQNDIAGRWRRHFSFCPGIHHSPSYIRGDAAQYPIAGFRLFDIIIIEFRNYVAVSPDLGETPT